ncbi:hypothetical protein [Brachyspira intermedia]|uniref:hypothetical protein n=1 Tax=Brachyspira intermedia TaxID=84377 RepID=UPI0030049559
MQKQIKILLTILMALALAVSCAKNNPNNPTKTKEQMLQQKWQDNDTSFGINQYIITDNKFENTYEGAVSYSFDIKEISWTSDTAGIIYGQYTANDDTSVIGKWYAVSFKDLTATTINICPASKQIGTDPDTNFPIYDYSAETLEEAKTKFTDANGYFGYYSDCTVLK